MTLAGRVVVVTGASSGIGAATAVELARLGAHVAVNYRSNQAGAEDTLRRIQELGGEALAVPGDVREDSFWSALRDEIHSKLGPIAALVSNAAMSFPRGPFRTMRWEDFHAKLHDELKAAFLGVQAMLPDFEELGGGHVILVGSSLGRETIPGFVAHGTAKAALAHFGRYLARELGPAGITVNVVAPGLVLTERARQQPAAFHEQIRQATPLGRLGRPEDIAGVIGLLLRDEARFLTGQEVVVDGGAILG